MAKETPRRQETIDQVLRSKRVPQKALAGVLNCTEATVSRKINGYLPITLDELHKIAAYLEVPVADLLPKEVSA